MAYTFVHEKKGLKSPKYALLYAVVCERRTVKHEINPPGPEHRGIVGNASRQARFRPAWQPHRRGRRSSTPLLSFSEIKHELGSFSHIHTTRHVGEVYDRSARFDLCLLYLWGGNAAWLNTAGVVSLVHVAVYNVVISWSPTSSLAVGVLLL